MKIYNLNNGFLTAQVVRITASTIVIQTNWNGYHDYHTLNKSSYLTLDTFVSDNFYLPNDN